jgi:hypothetical protein
MQHGISPIVVALDYPTSAQAIAMAQQLDPSKCRVKVGKELFTASGLQILEQLHKLNFDVFLDLKFHDIPNTCAVAAASELANKYPDRAHAILTERSVGASGPSGDEEITYQVSIRAPKNNLNGADVIAAKFGGGGRKGAAGTNVLPSRLQEEFFAMFSRVCN